MQIKQIKECDVTCDFGVCKNKAVVSVTEEGVSLENELRLCRECAEKLREVLETFKKTNKRG